MKKTGNKVLEKRKQALNIKYFLITDHVEKGDVEIKYCPTDNMICNYMTKSLQGVKFNKFSKVIMGLE